MNFAHSGDGGDVIMSLPCLRDLDNSVKRAEFLMKKEWNEQVQLLLVPCEGNPYFGGERFSKGFIEFLIPLLQYQEYLDKVILWEYSLGGIKDVVDLSLFRRAKVDFRKVPLSRVYSWVFQCQYDLSRPWLEVEVIPNDYIICNRTFRNRNNEISYGFMRKYGKIGFIGLEEEWLKFKEEVPNAQYFTCANALELGGMIGGCKFFVGNPSLCWNIAEALKVRRLLEVNACSCNCVPCGYGGYDAVNQYGFEYQFGRLYWELS